MSEITRMLSLALSQIGTQEQPPDSNRVKYNTAFYGKEVSGSAYPWCCAFIWWLFGQVGRPELFFGGKKTASCTTLYQYYRKLGQTIPPEQAQPGDLVFYVFDGNSNGIMNHIGLCERSANGSVTTIDGNTGTQSDANGGAVMRRTRSLRYVGGVARPAYSAEQKEEETMTQEQFTALYDQLNPLYTTLDQVPEYWRTDVQALISSGAIQGDNTHAISIRRDTLQAAIVSKRYADQHKS